MWKCPNCGRSFKKVNQNHFCSKAPLSIDEYILSQPEMSQEYLLEIRKALKEALPEAEERIAWGMPTYWKGQHIIHFAASKNHIGLYPGIEAVEEFKERLADYPVHKGTIRLPYQKPLPLDLIAEIAQWCYQEEIRED